MRKSLLLSLLGALLVIFCQLSAAQTPSLLQNHTTSNFDMVAANQTLATLSNQLTEKNITVPRLERSIDKLNNLQGEAKLCVTHKENQINKLDELWEKNQSNIKENETLLPLHQYLKTKQKELKAEKSNCQLFILRSDETIASFSKTMKTLRTQNLLTVKPDLWSNLVSGVTAIGNLHEQFDESIFSKYSGIKLVNTPTSITLFTVLLLISLIVGIEIRLASKKQLQQLENIETFGDKFHLALFHILQKYSISFFVFLFLTVDIGILTYLESHYNYLFAIVMGLLIYTGLAALLQFFFFPFRALTPISDLSENIAKPLLTRLKLLLNICFLGFVVYTFSYQQPFASAAINLARTTFLTLIIISLINILWLSNRIPKILEQHRVVRTIISAALTVALITLICAEWLGYQQLVSYVLTGTSLSLITLFFAWLLHKIIINGLRSIHRSDASLPEFLRHQLGARRYETIPELAWLQITLTIVIWGGLALTFLKIWKLSATHFQSLMTMLSDGIKFAGLHVIPSRIFSALIFATVALLFVRWIRNVLEQRHEDTTDAGSRQAFAAIVAYSGITIIILVTLLIAGVNFAGLAIIAGALSVGIGFGLQNIVNNFLSGIILLIERPIKPGDRVIINGEEGFVKRIRLRATQIRTLRYADLIVPNADLISKEITNMMFQDVSGRVHIQVGVAYGSDTDLVRQTLNEVIDAHPEIIKDDPARKPSVYFTEFKDSSLNFEIFVIIRNVNLKFIVKSELNTAIDKAFREKNITIAFPQRDIHIRNLTQENEKKIN